MNNFTCNSILIQYIETISIKKFFNELFTIETEKKENK